jgi:hypothetical protein
MTVQLEINGSGKLWFWFRPLLFAGGALAIAGLLLGNPQWEGGGYMQWWQRILFAAAFGFAFVPLLWRPMNILNRLTIGSHGIDVYGLESKWMLQPFRSKSFFIGTTHVKQVVLYKDAEGDESCRIDLVHLVDGCASIEVPNPSQGKSIKEQAEEIGRILCCAVIEQK